MQSDAIMTSFFQTKSGWSVSTGKKRSRSVRNNGTPLLAGTPRIILTKHLLSSLHQPSPVPSPVPSSTQPELLSESRHNVTPVQDTSNEVVRTPTFTFDASSKTASLQKSAKKIRFPQIESTLDEKYENLDVSNHRELPEIQEEPYADESDAEVEISLDAGDRRSSSNDVKWTNTAGQVQGTRTEHHHGDATNTDENEFKETQENKVPADRDKSIFKSECSINHKDESATDPQPIRTKDNENELSRSSEINCRISNNASVHEGPSCMHGGSNDFKNVSLTKNESKVENSSHSSDYVEYNDCQNVVADKEEQSHLSDNKRDCKHVSVDEVERMDTSEVEQFKQNEDLLSDRVWELQKSNAPLQTDSESGRKVGHSNKGKSADDHGGHFDEKQQSDFEKEVANKNDEFAKCEDDKRNIKSKNMEDEMTGEVKSDVKGQSTRLTRSQTAKHTTKVVSILPIFVLQF